MERPECWLNLNPQGARNALHIHPGRTFSGCYYAHDGGGGERSGEGSSVAHGGEQHGCSDRSDAGVGGCVQGQVAGGGGGGVGGSGGMGSFAGRLILLPRAPDALSEENLRHLRPLPSGDCAVLRRGGGTSAAPGASTTVGEDGAEDKGISFLRIDPVPGSMLIWPSFLPHAVLPCTAGGEPASGAVGRGVGSEPDGTSCGAHDRPSGPRLSVAFNFVHADSQ